MSQRPFLSPPSFAPPVSFNLSQLGAKSFPQLMLHFNQGRRKSCGSNGQKKSIMKTKLQYFCILLALFAGIHQVSAQDIGVTWTAQNSGSRAWQAVASSADGTNLVAAVNGGQIYTSTNSGVTWTAQISGGVFWNSVASSSDGSKLVAVVNYGLIYTSDTVAPSAPVLAITVNPVAQVAGATWTARDSSRGWQAVASSSDGTKLVAVVNGDQIYTSTNSGVTWTARDSSRNWEAVISSSDGTKLVAGEGGGHLYTSTDSGVTWTPRDSNRSWSSISSSSDGSILAAGVWPGQIYTSTDSGVTWTPRDSSRSWTCIASSADGTNLVAAGYGSGSGGPIYTSTNSGVTSTAQNSGNRGWVSVASSSDGTKLVAVVSGGQIYTSTDSGVTWTARDSSRSWTSVAASSDGSKLVSVVQYGQVYTSTLPPPGNAVKVSWPYPSPGWTLQQNSDLTTANWSVSSGISNDGTNNFFTLASPAGNIFFRLQQP